MEDRDDCPCGELKVSANVPEDCSFWLEDGGWNDPRIVAQCSRRGGADVKRNMEAALQTHIESVLREHSRASRTKVA